MNWMDQGHGEAYFEVGKEEMEKIAQLLVALTTDGFDASHPEVKSEAKKILDMIPSEFLKRI